jgi:D-sedoheptulose 7-phosphate isomerase
MMAGRIASMIRQRRENRNTIFVCGNGGSATTAEHFTNDLFAKGVKAICLNSNTAIMTMIANDFGYEHVFEKQLEVYAEPNDLLVVFSCSGTSLNIERAIQVGVETIPFFGVDGESYQSIEDRHLSIAHEISEKV